MYTPQSYTMMELKFERPLGTTAAYFFTISDDSGEVYRGSSNHTRIAGIKLELSRKYRVFRKVSLQGIQMMVLSDVQRCNLLTLSYIRSLLPNM